MKLFIYKKLKQNKNVSTSHEDYPKALYTLDILMHNITIKRSCDKKIILSNVFLLAKVSS